jgi:drug/metabolite transporter (DMT)-like permease
LTPFGYLQLFASVAIFILAAHGSKSWALDPSWPRMAWALLLYSAGNVIIMRLVREVGMAMSFSLSSVIQLVAVNAMAFLLFGERVDPIQAFGIALALVAVALITLGPSLAGRS